jgi:hypothetical protein
LVAGRIEERRHIRLSHTFGLRKGSLHFIVDLVLELLEVLVHLFLGQMLRRQLSGRLLKARLMRVA